MNPANVKKQRNKIGGYLKSTRTQKGLSMYLVAQRAGMKIGQIKAMEEGNTSYTIDSLLKVLSALETTTTALGQIID